MERMRGRGGACGGGYFFVQAGGLNNKNYKNKIRCGLIQPPFNILHITTNQKHTGTMEEGWDRTPDWVGTLEDRNSTVLGAIDLNKINEFTK